MGSFDVASLCTNVPVTEAIQDCVDLLYSGKYKVPHVDKTTFKKVLLTMRSLKVLMLTNEGYFHQIDSLTMGNSPVSLIANCWLSIFDAIIKDDAIFYEQYMDDILRNIKENRIQNKLEQINNLHP